MRIYERIYNIAILFLLLGAIEATINHRISDGAILFSSMMFYYAVKPIVLGVKPYSWGWKICQ